MPRPRRARTIGAEDHLATRIRSEMDRRHWSYAMLARQMSRIGVDISSSSLQKSFAPDKDPDERRPIRVDELVAIARALGMSVENLLSPRCWVDQEQVDKALADLDRADSLLAEAVQTMLDAQIMLTQAAAQTPADQVQHTVSESTAYWSGTSNNLHIVPRGATSGSAPIATQAIGKRLSALKEVIHAIAVQWTQLEALNLPQWKLQGMPIIGSEDWDTI